MKRSVVKLATTPPGLSAEQLQLKQRLQEECSAARPTHRITLRNGEVIAGRLEKETAVTIYVREGYGYSGCLLLPLPRQRILRIESLPATSVLITDSDVRLCTEFPGFHFIKVPSYSLVTDESYSEVERILRDLSGLHRQFTTHFASLIRRQDEPHEIQVVFFGKEEAFRDYAQRVAPSFVNSAGFYSAGEQRLALLNQRGTSRYSRLVEQLTRRQNEVPLSLNQPAQQHLAAWRSGVSREARSMTERLVRHEGAHQLFHRYGINSECGVEPTWLIEGLASYCEPAEIGRQHRVFAERLVQFRDAGTLVPLTDLLDHRSAAGFFAWRPERAEAAYAESWALVQLLMEDSSRDDFLRLLKFYRDVDQPAAVDQTVPSQLLTQYLRTNVAQLEVRWQAYLRRL